MNFKKEHLKESISSDKITDLVIFEKGSNIPKRVKKETFNSSLPSGIYKVAITQLGTDAPTVDWVIVNTLVPDGDISFTRSNSGRYSVHSASNAFVHHKVSCEVHIPYFPDSVAYSYLGDSSFLAIETRSSGVYSDNLLAETILTIEVYS